MTCIATELLMSLATPELGFAAPLLLISSALMADSVLSWPWKMLRRISLRRVGRLR